MPLIFEPADPFPLLPEGSHTYAEAQTHSEEVDRWLGLQTALVEATLRRQNPGKSEQELWQHLPPRSFLTPYTELRTLLSRLPLQSGQTLVDLGAGYGRMGFVLGHHYPEVRFIGLEIAPERVAEALRCLKLRNYPGARMLTADLAHPDFVPPLAEYYFIYDYGSRQAISKTLEDLRRLAQKRALTVIGRGRGVRDAIEREHPWLSQVIAPEHFGHFSIYRSGYRSGESSDAV